MTTYIRYTRDSSGSPTLSWSSPILTGMAWPWALWVRLGRRGYGLRLCRASTWQPLHIEGVRRKVARLGPLAVVFLFPYDRLEQ